MYQVQKMVGNKSNKPKRSKKLKPDTIKKLISAVNKKLVKLKFKNLISKHEYSTLKSIVAKTPKVSQH